MPSPLTLQRRLKKDLCAKCGIFSRRPNRTTCQPCAQTARKTDAVRRRERQKNGLCMCCGNRPGINGTTRCLECGNRHSKSQQRRRTERTKDGFCMCKNKAVAGQKCCEDCLQISRGVTAKKKRDGICLECCEPAASGHVFCSYHNIQNRIRGLHLVPGEKEKVELAVKNFNGVCQNPGCGATTPGISNRDWSLDHDHKTKKFRGIICHPCNVLLGQARDSEEVLLGAIEYLKRSRTVGDC